MTGFGVFIEVFVTDGEKVSRRALFALFLPALYAVSTGSQDELFQCVGILPVQD